MITRTMIARTMITRTMIAHRHFYLRGLFCTLILATVACGPLIPSPADEISYFVIEDSVGEPIETGMPRSEANLLVRGTKANRFINSHKIIFSKDPAQRGYYQLARWVEPPPSRITSILIDKLERAKVCRSISRLGSATLGEYQLNSEVSEFFHDIRNRPGLATIKMTVEIIDLSKRSILAQKTFVVAQEATSYSAEGAVEGLTEASNQLLDEVVIWTSEQLARQSSD